jgi:hypothetical protein
MPIFKEIEEGRVGKRPFLQPLTWFGRYISHFYIIMIHKSDKKIRATQKICT